MKELTSAQRKELRGLAHSFEPTVLIGRGLLSPHVLREIKESLNAHELIKVKFLEGKDERKRLAEEMASKTESSLVGLIGNIAILYRQQPNPKKRRIKLSAPLTETEALLKAVGA